MLSYLIATVSVQLSIATQIAIKDDWVNVTSHSAQILSAEGNAGHTLYNLGTGIEEQNSKQISLEPVSISRDAGA